MSDLVLNDWQDFGNSIFSEMTQVAQEYKAVNLAQGFPDFEGPEGLLKAASQAILQGKNQYAPSIGVKVLRHALSAHYERNFSYTFDPDRELTVFSGATEAIWCAVGALVRPGEEVLVLAPTFDIYPAAVFGAHAKLVVHELDDLDWSIDFHELEKKISNKTRAIIINNPMNPLGKVFSQTELESIARIAIKYNLIVISDEVYDHLVFAPHKHIPLHQMSGMFDRTVTISSSAKTFSVTGWKVGYAFACEALTSRIRLIHQFTVFCSATPLQWALASGFAESDQSFLDLRNDLSEKCQFLNSVLCDLGFKTSPCQAGYFIAANFSELSKLDDKSYAMDLTRHGLVATIPLSSFYFKKSRTGWLRFAFCKKQETLEAAAKNLKNYLGRKL